MQNGVPRLSSAIFTTDLRESERFLSVRGSDCGIAKRHIGTSGAEIGGAFGGEKETAAAGKAEATHGRVHAPPDLTVNYSDGLPLAHIQFL